MQTVITFRENALSRQCVFNFDFPHIATGQDADFSLLALEIIVFEDILYSGSVVIGSQDLVSFGQPFF